MTDRSVFCDMLSRAGVKYREAGLNGGSEITIAADDGSTTKDAPLHGYSGFSASFEFDDAGNLKSVGIYE